MQFPGQLPNESTLLLVRRHGFILFRQAFIVLIGTIIPLVIYYLLKNYTTALHDSTSIVFLLLVLGGSVYYLFVLLFLYTSWVDYYLDLWVLTDERIVSIEQKGLFSRTVGELKLYRVQDVTSNVHGFLATVLRYGNVRIQTAGEQSQFEFEQVPHPYDIAKRIMEAHDRYMKEKGVPLDGELPADQQVKAGPPNTPTQ